LSTRWKEVAEPFEATLEVGGETRGVPCVYHPGALRGALTMASGQTYPMPVPSYHEAKLCGVPRGMAAYAVGVRLSPAALTTISACPACVEDQLAFAHGMAMPPKDVFQPIPALAAPALLLERVAALETALAKR
jgi:hypothetical protein